MFKKKRHLFHKPTILGLVFLFVLMPLTPALARPKPAPKSSASQTNNSSITATDYRNAPASSGANETAETNQPTTGTADDDNKKITADQNNAQAAAENSETAENGQIKKQSLASASLPQLPNDNETPIDQGFCKNCLLKQSNGSLNYSYELPLPPGRHGLTPRVVISYSQFNRDISSPIGFGWELATGQYIERSSRLGSSAIYTAREFKFISYGNVIKLLPLESSQELYGSYGAKTEETFSRYEYLANDSWVVTDVKGVKYYFGQTMAARQNDPNSSARVFRWLIEKIEDLNGDIINYSYFKDQGQIYPKEISYANNIDNIGLYSVKFEPFASGSLTIRSDKSLSYVPGFRVMTNYRLEKISLGVKENNNFTAQRECRLDYTKRPDAKVYSLSAISEAGWDGSAWQSLPKIEFSYDIVKNGYTIDTQTKWNYPPEKGGDVVWTMGGDVNGDGLNDQINFKRDGSKEIYLNSGQDGWRQASGDWHIPGEINWTRVAYQNPPTMKVAGVDINSDNFEDLIIYDISKNTYNVYLHNGASGWDYHPGPWSNPQLVFGCSQTDINSDGLIDYVWNLGSDVWRVYLNNGHNGWGGDGGIGWRLPSSAESLNGADINNDGLSDLVWKTLQTIVIYGEPAFGKAVYLYNNRDGWEKVYSNTDKNFPDDFGWQIPDSLNTGQCNNFNLDLNNDKINDVMNLARYGSESSCQSAGSYGYNGTSGWEKTELLSGVPTYRGTVASSADYNNDGWADYRLRYYDQAEQREKDIIYLNTANNTFFLNSISNGRGGRAEIAYQSARSFRKANGQLANPRLKWDKFVVKKISYLDRDQLSQSAEYSYEDGEYIREDAADPWSREFAGFHSIKTADLTGRYTIEYFHQGGGLDGTAKGEHQDNFSKKGKPYRLEQYSSAGQLYAVQINKFDFTDLGQGRYFPKLASQISAQYDGNSDYRATAKTYDYDQYGNAIKAIDYGEVILTDDAGGFKDILNDQNIADWEYAANAEKNIHALPGSEKKHSQTGQLIGQRNYYYDQLPSGSAEKGNLTRLETLISQSGGADKFKTEEIEYNSYGLPIKTKNARGFLTETVYDDNQIFPRAITNAKAQTTTYVYDLFYGQVKETKDPNGLVTKTIFDGLGRPSEIKISDPADPANLLTKTAYSYNDSNIPNSVSQTDFTQNNGIDIKKISYFDGLGRPIQTRSEAAGDNFIVENLSYDQNGNVKKKFLPIFSAGPDFTPIEPTALGEEYGYDPFNRLTVLTNSLGATAINYDQWQKTVIDPLGKKKDLLYDAANNLVEVHEYLNGVSYATRYGYDALNNLTSVTDALGNARHFTYDFLGRRLTAEDLHAPADATFSIWSYGYDDNDNLVSRADGRGATINYNYDELDRLTSETNLETKKTETSRAYDAGAYAIGRLASASFGSGNRRFQYNILGQAIGQTATINNQTFTTAYSYDLLNNSLTITYPDGQIISYNYNNAGQVSRLKQGEQIIADNISYEANGQIKTLSFANSVITANTYDPAKLYRLTNKKTSLAGQALQDISYTYDAVGNITDLADAAATGAARTAHYAYDDLYRLVSANITSLTAASPSYAQVYSYDIIGNILNKSDVGDYLYQGDQGQSYANPQAATRVAGKNYGYDKNGNLISANGWQYSWDYDNRLIGANRGVIKAQYGYDENGERTFYSNGLDSTIFYPDKYFNVQISLKTILVQQSCSSGSKKPNSCLNINLPKTTILTKNTKQIYLGDLLLATVETENGKNNTYYAHTDHLTGSNVISDVNGKIVETLDYYPFGAIRIDQKIGSFSEQKKFTGKELDADTGLYYYGARYYDGRVGRWVSEDQVAQNNPEKLLEDPQALNNYAYSRNNPLILVDKNGNFFQIATMALGAVAGAAWGGIDAYNLVKHTFEGNLEAASRSSEKFLAKTEVGILSGLAAGELALPILGTYAPNLIQRIKGQTLPELTNKIDDLQGYYSGKNIGFKLDSRGRVLDGRYPADGMYKAVVKDGEVIYGREKFIPGTGNTNTFSHADLVNGENVNFAGTMKFKKGELQWYNEYSGHYKGEGNQQVIEKSFKNAGVNYKGKFKNLTK